MFKKTNIYMYLVMMFTIMAVSGCLPQKVDASSNEGRPSYGKTFYEDVPDANNNPLGASGYFHIFANKANLKNHTAGNVATKELSGTSNFGTPNNMSAEYNYIQHFKEFNSASGTANGKIVFGKDISVELVNGGRPSIQDNANQTRTYPLDRYTQNDVYQDRHELPEYIDFEKEFSNLTRLSNKIINTRRTIYVTNDYFQNKNQRVIDLTNINDSDIYINLSPEVLKANTPLTFKGLEKNIGIKTFKNVYIVVNTDSSTDYKVLSKIKFSYTDGTNRENKETTDFSDNTVLWTFANGGTPYTGNITLSSTWLGSILAPQSSLGGGQNIDGNIIVDTFKGAGETHGWNWQPNKKDHGVKLIKVDSNDKNILLSGAEFSLYRSDGTLVKEHLVTDKDGQLFYNGLSAGDYYFVETKAPKGYGLAEKHYNFTINEDHNGQVLEIEASNKKAEEPTVSVKGRKTWFDNDNKDNVRPDAINIRLFANDKEITHKVVTAKDGWRYDFGDLPKNDKYGREIKYTLKEDNIKGYESEINRFNINNTYKPDTPEPATRNLNVSKVWKDGNNKDHKRPDKITVQLYSNGEKYGNPVILSKETNWKYTWSKLPSELKGKLIKYTVKEIGVDKNYKSSVDDSDPNNIFLINKYTPDITEPTIPVKGQKTWSGDNNNQDRTRPDSVTIRLFANGKEIDHKIVMAKDGWKYDFGNLPKNDENGKEITYSLKEDDVNHYVTTISGFNVTNTYKPEIPVKPTGPGQPIIPDKPVVPGKPPVQSQKSVPSESIMTGSAENNILPQTGRNKTDNVILLAIGLSILAISSMLLFLKGKFYK